jgi:hypothetical protein
MKAMLLRVGIDTACGGTLGPIFEDGSFEFVPIPEYPGAPRAVPVYSETPGRWGRVLSTYVPKALIDAPMHYDPEFETCTYGDPTTIKRRYLLKLHQGDLLVFYAGLKPYKNDVYETALYIIGYFTIDRIIDFNESTRKQIAAYCEEFANNAHLGRDSWYHNLVIASGDKNKSRLLDHAIKISKRKPNKAGRLTYAISAEMEQQLGIDCFIERSVPPRFVVGETYLANLKKILAE